MVEARFVGHHSRTSSIIGLTPDGVIYGLCAKRLPRELRWPKEGCSDLKGLPWGQKLQVRDLPEAATDPERIVIIQQQPQPQQPAEQRNFYVTRAHVDDNHFGETPGCPKCNALRIGAKITASHSQACRDRVLARVREDDADRAQDYDYRQVRRALSQQDAQVQVRQDESQEGLQQPFINDGMFDGDGRQERKRGSEAQTPGGASASEEPVAKRPMSSTQLSRRWERLSEGRYERTPDRPKRLAETPLEEHGRER